MGCLKLAVRNGQHPNHKRVGWWWRASRVIQDYELNGTVHEIIDEFPFFSYLLGDLHPHVLAMPFNLLAVAVALNLFLGGWQGTINFFFGQLKISRIGFFIIALVLGGLAFLNEEKVLFKEHNGALDFGNTPPGVYAVSSAPPPDCRKRQSFFQERYAACYKAEIYNKSVRGGWTVHIALRKNGEYKFIESNRVRK